MTQQVDGIGCLIGIAPWKRARIVRMLANRHGPPVVRSTRAAIASAQRNAGAIAGWASRLPADLPLKAQAAGLPLWRIEDGFIRSTGLGAELNLPCSIVVDRTGLHYDSSRPSDLETILATAPFDSAMIKRAQDLAATIVATRVTKYNLAGPSPDLPSGRPLVLVLGQVDDDLSVLCGGAGQTVAAMVRKVRCIRPDAALVFKPHPDVVAGLRRGFLGEGAADVITLAPLPDLLPLVDEVHVLTSLGGFEALLRGCRVVVHGQPFYAGWGLTDDRAPILRRQRRLTLPELVAGTLIEYPLYCHPETGDACEVEELVAVLARLPDAQPARGWRKLRSLGGVRLASVMQRRKH